jgi:putative endonuclease
VPAASPMRTAKRRVGRDRGAAQRHGLAAETWAAWRLRLAGYRVLARNFRVGAGEIDLIVRRGNVVAFVEVKARADDTAAAEALQPMQRQRIRNAAAAFLARRPDLAGLDLRFDVVLVVPRRLPRHIQDAWRDSG